MTVADLINDILEREGSTFTWDQSAGDPPTRFGITPEPLGIYRRLGRNATPEEVQTVERSEASAILYEQYVVRPGFLPLPDPLRAQLVDFGFNSGPSRAIRWLQRVAHLQITGVLDVETRDLIHVCEQQGLLHLLNAALVAGRLDMIDRWTDANLRKKKLEEGVESRALKLIDYGPNPL